MELIFLIISILISLTIAYSVGRVIYSHRGLIRAYKTSEFLGIVHVLFAFMMAMVLFITLCAINNTFWHLPYLTH